MDRKIIEEIVDVNFSKLMNINEKRKKRKNKKKKRGPNKVRNKHIDKAKIKRTRVIKWLQDNSVNCAEIMRLLWHPSKKKEDGARSYFYKCRDGKLNDNGDPYSFTDSDITRLYSIRNGKS